MTGPQMLLFGGVTNVYRGFTGGTVADFEIDPSDASASITLVTDGSVSKIGNQPGSSMSNWYLPNTVGIGTSHWVRATVTSGTLTSGTAGTWLQLSSNRTWNKQQTIIGASSVTFTLELATDSGGANIVATCSVTLTAEVDA